MRDLDPRWRFAAGGVLLVVLGWFPFVRGTRVPLLGWVDLAVHEAGHVLFFWLPDVGTAIMGNGFQVLMPLLFAGSFLVKQRDLLGTSVTLGWAASSLQDASVYIADAPFLDLPLIGGHHDWAFVLTELGVLAHAGAIARAVWVAGLMLLLVAVWLCAAGPVLEPRLQAWRREPPLAQPRTPPLRAPVPPAMPSAGGEGYFGTPPARPSGADQ